MRLVVDASVAIKWVISEVHSASAMRALRRSNDLLAPDLIWAEIGNVLWKKHRAELLEAQEAEQLLLDLRRFPLRIFPSPDLYEEAWDIAVTHSRTFYDSLYLALAVKTNCRLVTADRKLLNAFQKLPLSAHLLWIEDLP